MRTIESQRSSEVKKQIYFINSKDVNEDIWNGIVKIYTSVFYPDVQIARPEFNELNVLHTPNGGEYTFFLHRDSNKNSNGGHLLEVRTKISGHELFYRFKVSTTGSIRNANKGDVFLENVEEYLRLNKVELVPHTEIC